MNETPTTFDISALLGQATQLPWRWYWRAGDNGEADCGILHESRPGHAYSVCRCPRYVDEKTWQANAQLIVTAVNALQAVLKLREIATKVVQEDDDLPAGYQSFAIREQRTALQELDALLGLPVQKASQTATD